MSESSVSGNSPRRLFVLVVLGVLAGLTAFTALAAIFVAWNWYRGRLDRALAEQIEALDELNALLDTVQDEATARQALPQVRALTTRYREAEQRFDELQRQRVSTANYSHFTKELHRRTEGNTQAFRQGRRIARITGGIELAQSLPVPWTPPRHVPDPREEPAPSDFPVAIWNAKIHSFNEFDVEFRVDKPELLTPGENVYWIVELNAGDRKEIRYELRGARGVLAGEVFALGLPPHLDHCQTWLEIDDPNGPAKGRRPISNVTEFQH